MVVVVPRRTRNPERGRRFHRRLASGSADERDDAQLAESVCRVISCNSASPMAPPGSSQASPAHPHALVLKQRTSSSGKFQSLRQSSSKLGNVPGLLGTFPPDGNVPATSGNVPAGGKVLGRGRERCVSWNVQSPWLRSRAPGGNVGQAILVTLPPRSAITLKQEGDNRGSKLMVGGFIQ